MRRGGAALFPRSLDGPATEDAGGGTGAGEGALLGNRVGCRDSAIEAFERHADLRRALEKLGARERLVLVLRYLEGLSRRAAAEGMEVCMTQAPQRLEHQALELQALGRQALGRLRETHSG